MSGKATASRNGSTGSTGGSSGGAPIVTSSPPAPGVAISITSRRPPGQIGTLREPAGALIGSWTVSIPSS
jgi:hypothetical protein